MRVKDLELMGFQVRQLDNEQMGAIEFQVSRGDFRSKRVVRKSDIDTGFSGIMIVEDQIARQFLYDFECYEGQMV